MDTPAAPGAQRDHRTDDQRGGSVWPAAARPGKSRISSPSCRAWRATPIIESTFDVGRRFRCTLPVDCGQLDPGAVIWPEPGEWHPRMPERLEEDELADWRAGRNAVYQLAALSVGARLAVADAYAQSCHPYQPRRRFVPTKT
jgi:hypothetical protein